MTAPTASKTQRPWLLYLLECAGGKLYIGISPDPEARFRMHLRGTGAKYTRANPPLRILAAQVFADRSAASVAEHALKQQRRDAKLRWAQGHSWPLQPVKRERRAPRKAAARSAAERASGG